MVTLIFNALHDIQDVQDLPKPILHGCRRGLLLATLMCFTSLATAQERAPSKGDIPWPAESGAGRLTEPGRSRLLPSDGNATANRGNAQPPTRLVSSQTPVNQSSLDAGDAAAGQQNWWNEEAQANGVTAEADQLSRNVQRKDEIIKSSQIMAMVGSEPILAADMLGRINEMLAPHAAQASEEQLEAQRLVFMERMLPSLIEEKTVYLEFRRSLEPEQLEMVRANIYQAFDEKRLPEMLEQSDLESLSDLDARLRSFGSSLDRMRQRFFEQMAAREIIQRETRREEEITHDELLQYYQEHRDEYAFPSKVKWEQLSALFSDERSKQDSYKQVARMGNMVLRGKSWTAVAREESETFNASRGGAHDWTEPGSLRSNVLESAIFSLPPNQLSRILEDETGFHIVRVVERTEEGVVPFAEAQVEIREKLKLQKQDERVKQWLEELKGKTYVWNFFEQQQQNVEMANGRSDDPLKR